MTPRACRFRQLALCGPLILSGVVVLGLVLICLGMGNRAGLEENFKAASAPGVCMMLSAAALFICALVQLLDKPDLFTTLVSILGLGGASALAYSGYLRLSGKASGPCRDAGVPVFGSAAHLPVPGMERRSPVGGLLF